MSRNTSLRLWVLLALGLLAACGGTSVPGGTAPTALSPGRLPTAPATVPPTVVSPTIAATQPALVTAITQPTTIIATTQPAAVDTVGATIPQGVTPEGYHVLGRPDAPVTLTNYSDFL